MLSHCHIHVHAVVVLYILYREYSQMVSVRRVDFTESDRPKMLKMAKHSEHPVRSSPQLIN